MKNLNPEQVGRLIKAARSDRDKLLFTLLFEHWLRISECFGLTWAHVKRAYLQIPGKKKGRRADEKLNPATLALFESGTKTLFPATLILPISRQSASQLFHRAYERSPDTAPATKRFAFLAT